MAVYVRGVKGEEERIQTTRQGHTVEEPYAMWITCGLITTVNIRRHRDMVAVALVCVILEHHVL
jgi:hypothetical protein